MNRALASDRRIVAPGRGLVVPVFAITLAVATGILVNVHPAFSVAAILAWVPLLLTRRPRYGIYLLTLTLAVNVNVLNDPVHISLPQLVGLFVIAAAVVRLALRALPHSTSSGAWAWSGFIFAAATTPSFFGTSFPASAIAGELQIMLVGFLLFATTRLLIAYPQSIEPTLTFLGIAAVISVVPALAQTIFGLGPESFVRYGIMRAHSTYGQPNSYGLYLAGMVPLFFGLSTHKRWFVFPLALTSIALVATLSRGAISGASLAVLGQILFHRGSAQSRGFGIVAGVSIVVTAAVIIALPTAVTGGLTNFGDWSSQQRALTIFSSFAAIRARPILGYGAGSFVSLRPDIAMSGLVDDIEMPHNFLIEIWMELGLVALFSFVLLVTAYYIVTFRVYRRTADPVLFALVAAFSGMLITSATSSLLIRGIEECFVLLVALTAARLTTLRNISNRAHSIHL